jgi:hypothetical protein
MDETAVSALRALYQSRPDFIEFFEALRSRERNRSALTAESFLKAPEIDRSNYNAMTMLKKVREFFNELEQVGLGKLIVGRRGAKTRFVWAAPLGQVNKVIEEVEKGYTAQTWRSGDPDIRRKNEASTADVAIDLFSHKYILRQDCVVTIDLPIDLTVNEAERLSGFIKTLPISATK